MGPTYPTIVWHHIALCVLSQFGIPRTSFFAMGVYVGLSVRGNIPLPLRFSSATWAMITNASQHSSKAHTAFAAGFQAVVPLDPLSMLWTEAQLARVVCGDDAVDIALLRSVTIYENVCAACLTEPVITGCVLWLCVKGVLLLRAPYSFCKYLARSGYF